jgi:DUF4097 and DUF4098 domain-containing protein YvlB
MKLIKLSSIALLLSILFANTIAAKDWVGEKTKSFKLSKGGFLIVELNAGDISVSTWDQEEVLLKVNGVTNNGFKNVESSISGNVLTVKYDNYEDEDDVSFNFTVPSKFNLDLKTLAGDVKIINDLTGNVTVDTYGGDIKTIDINGSLKLETKGGDIRLGDINGDCNVNTYGGDISVGVINGKSAKISTNGGDISIKKSTSGVYAKTYGGEITVGDLGGDSELITYGGDVKAGNVKGDIKLETYGGNLELSSAKGKVRGKTNGGDIKLRNIEGSVDIKTMAGSISVELNPAANSESRISTSAGSIELLIPGSAKTAIEARIHVQGWWKEAKETLKIESDFAEESSTLNEDKKEIVSKYELNGGGSTIYLQSVNDIITIKKSK